MPVIAPSLSKWIGDSDARRQLEQFDVDQGELQLAYLAERADDYYLTLVGQLFEFMRADEPVAPSHWARLGNALTQLSSHENRAELVRFGINAWEARTFGAAAFYFGSFPASASLILRQAAVPQGEEALALFELLARPAQFASQIGRQLVAALISGNRGVIQAHAALAARQELRALREGPDAWIRAKLWHKVIARFAESNLRAVLPDGYSDFWTPLVTSMAGRFPAVYEFFPSQTTAIHAGLLTSDRSFSLQMPTGAGKTALCETLLFSHAKRYPDSVSVLLVPYRSLAAELRRTIVPRLGRMGVTAACSYGGTVPSPDELHALDETQVVVATPESLAGMLTADRTFLDRVSLVICDEGHLLDAPGRGIALELLLARFKARLAGAPRFIFISAIVPNIEQINAWLGGNGDTVIKSDYRPAHAEYGLLWGPLRGAVTSVEIVMHPEQQAPVKYSIPGFLVREDFRFINGETGRWNTYTFSSFKTQAVAAARKSLTMGGVAIFAANKRGDQGAIGVAEELLKQLEAPLRLPKPSDSGNAAQRGLVAEYLAAEYGEAWVGARLMLAGAVLHHGDIPQETREVLESTLRKEHACLAICTNTLAEGVNLPIRTLVLYSVLRNGSTGRPVPLQARDIKNLVGRAGRAGATTRGLVICANRNQWEYVEPVARQQPGENVAGSLFRFLVNLRRFLALRNVRLSNEILERGQAYFPLVDGLDNALIDLLAEEVGEEEMVRMAQTVVEHTFAATTAADAEKRLLHEIVQFRATRINELRAQGRLAWVKETGAKVRTLREVETGLLPMRESWDDITEPTDEGMVTIFFNWAWPQRDMSAAVMDAYRITPNDLPGVRDQVLRIVRLWLSGARYQEIARQVGLPVDETLGVITRVINYTLLTIVEQGVSLLKKLLEEHGRVLAEPVELFADCLRYGLPSGKSVALAAAGVRHRFAARMLAQSTSIIETLADRPAVIVLLARNELRAEPTGWQERLGSTVFANTKIDVGA